MWGRQQWARPHGGLWWLMMALISLIIICLIIYNVLMTPKTFEESTAIFSAIRTL